MPQAPVPSSRHAYNPDCSCSECAAVFLERLRTRRVHEYGADEDPLGPAKGILNAVICMIVILLCLAGAILIWSQTADARTNQTQPQPILRPAGLLQAKQQCPDDATIVECRAALRRALAGIAWQRSENLKLARQMLGKLADWTCIHGGEGAWNAHTGNGYYGGLQMDATFERTYGRDMLARYRGHADSWPPKAQIIVAQRAYAQGRGYAPWPNTSHACGLR